MKVIARQATEAERAELDALVVWQPDLKAEFERLQAEVRLAREVLPLINATEATAPELPAYARGRLQTKVRETLGRPQAPEEDALGTLWKWRWILGLAAATAVVALFLLPVLSKSAPPMIQVAMLDTAGATRGSDTNEASLLHQTWEKAPVDSFTGTEALHAWEANWPAQNEQRTQAEIAGAAQEALAGAPDESQRFLGEGIVAQGKTIVDFCFWSAQPHSASLAGYEISLG
jgi:hypothetical protein